MGPADVLREALRPTVEATGLTLWDVERTASLVRVLVDRPSGVDLEAISTLSSRISAVLDASDDLVPAGRYVLEVSSPGLERTLRTPEQFRRFLGGEVSIKTCRPVAGARRLRGILLEADDTGITIEVAPDVGAGSSPASSGPVAIDYAGIERARTVFEWRAATRPVSPSRAGRPARAGTQRRAPATMSTARRPSLPAEGTRQTEEEPR